MKNRFAKYQALGNGFIVIDEIFESGKSKKFENLAQHLCDPNFGVGGDGILILSGKKERYRVDVYNADGSWAENSGNGVRIAAMHLVNKGLIKKDEIDLMTGSGEARIKLFAGDKFKRQISTSLGQPVFEASKIPVKTDGKYFINQTVECEGKKFVGSAVSVGNPHLILFCHNLEFDWEEAGELLETHPLFPHRTNVGFVVLHSEELIELCDYERGVGPTLSSGTGAAAAVAVSVMRGFTNRRVKVETGAGLLQVLWEEKTDQIVIKGPVEYICEGLYS